MKMSRKLMIIFSCLAVLTTACNCFYFYNTRMEALNESTYETLTALGNKLQAEIEQYIQLMDYAMEELTSNVGFMDAMHIACLQGETANIMEMGDAQTRMSRILYQEPLLERFYRVSVYARNGFYQSSRFEKTDCVVSLSEEAHETVAALPYLAEVDANPFQRHLIGPHTDPWSSTRDVAVVSIVRAVIWHGQFIGYLEVADQLEELYRIFTVEGLDGFHAHAIFDDGEQFFRVNGDDAVYTNLDPNGMTRCKMADGSERLVVGIRVKSLGMNIYVAQEISTYYQQASEMMLKYVSVAFLMLLITLVLVIAISLGLTRSIRKLTRKVLHLPVGDLLDQPSEALTTLVTSKSDEEIYDLEKVFNGLMARLQVSLRNEINLHEGALKAQLNALQAQINPHFVYNTLNIISAKGMESGNEEIIDICDQFAQMLRYSTDLRSRTATLGEELKNAQMYLLLSKARYEDQLTFDIDVPEQMATLLIPKLTLQPLVENTLAHGFAGRTDVRNIQIIGTLNENVLQLVIRDNGNGFAPEVLKKLEEAFRRIDEENEPANEFADGHIGLANTYLRLHYYSMGKMRMALRNDSGAVVELTLPCERKEEHV